MDLENMKIVLIRQRILVVAILLLGLLVAAVASHHRKTYTAQSAVVLVTAANTQNAPEGNTTRMTVLVGDLPTMVQSTAVLKYVARDLGNDFSISELRKNVKARAPNESSIMPITYTGATSESAIRGANAFADELTAYYRTISTSRFDRLLRDLRSQIEAKRSQLAGIDAALSKAAISDPYIDPKTGNDTMSSETIGLHNKRNALQSTLQGDSASAMVLSHLLEQFRPLAAAEIGAADPSYQKLRQQVASDQATQAHMRAAFSADYPGLPEIINQNHREDAQLKAAEKRVDNASPYSSKSYAAALSDKMRADAVVKNDQAQLNAVDRQLAQSTSAMQITVHNGLNVSRLRLDRDSASNAYAVLQSRLTTALADRAEAASIGSISVIDRAESATVSKGSNGLVVLLICLAIAAWGAVSLASFVDKNAQGNSTVRRLEKFYEAPVFTIVGS